MLKPDQIVGSTIKFEERIAIAARAVAEVGAFGERSSGPMRRVFPFGELGLAGFQEPLENGAEIESCLGRADSAKLVDTPNHAGGTKIEAGVAVANSFVERVRGPESLGIKMFKPIRNDVLDCGGGVALTPGDRP